MRKPINTQVKSTRGSPEFVWRESPQNAGSIARAFLPRDPLTNYSITTSLAIWEVVSSTYWRGAVSTPTLQCSCPWRLFPRSTDKTKNRSLPPFIGFW